MYFAQSFEDQEREARDGDPLVELYSSICCFSNHHDFRDSRNLSDQNTKKQSYENDMSQTSNPKIRNQKGLMYLRSREGG